MKYLPVQAGIFWACPFPTALSSVNWCAVHFVHFPVFDVQL